MTDHCSSCTDLPVQARLKLITQRQDHSVYICTECSTFWKKQESSWLAMVPDKKHQSQSKAPESGDDSQVTFKLVKDFRDFKFSYYWIDLKGNAVSPALETVQLAEEWYIDYHYSQHTGPERRRRRIDRRQPDTSTTAHANSRRRGSIPGRRKSDRQIKVDLDISGKKIAALKETLSGQQTPTPSQDKVAV